MDDATKASDRTVGAESKRGWLAVVAPILGALLTISVAVRWLASGWGADIRFDDAWFFLRYAEHLLDGHGLAWNAGERPVYGVTSLAHQLVVTLLLAITTLRGSELLFVSSAVPAFLAGGVMAWTASRWMPGGSLLRQPLVWLGALSLLLMRGRYYQRNAMTGMDTGLGCLTLAVVVALAVSHAREPRILRLGAVLAAAWLAFNARPDTGLFLALFPAGALLSLQGFARGWRKAALYFVGLASVLLGDAAIKLWLFGDYLPLSHYAKQSGFYEGYVGRRDWNPFEYLAQIWFASLPFLAVLVWTVRRPVLPMLAALLAPVALTFAYLGTVVQVMGYNARYYVPFLGVVVLASAWSLGHWLRLPPDARALSRGGRAGRIVAIVLIGVAQPAFKAASGSLWEAVVPTSREFRPQTRYATEASSRLPSSEWDELTDALKELWAGLPPGTVTSMSEYGMVGQVAPRVAIVDPLGLHDREVAHHGFDVDRFFAAEPELIWMPHPHYTSINARIVDADQLWAEYDFYPEAFGFGVLVRRDGERAETVAAALARAWRRLYGDIPMAPHRARRSE